MINSSRIAEERTAVGQLADFLDLYMPPILIVIGVTCNTFVILVMRTSYFCKTSTSLYMSFNAVVDNITLAVAFPAHWIHVSFPDLIYRGKYSDLICKTFHFIGSSTSNIGIVLTAAMTLERAFAIKFPLKAPRLCTKRKAKIVTFGLVMFVCLKDLHYLILSKMVSEDIQQYLCAVEATSAFIEVYDEHVWPIMQNIMLFASFLVIIVCNVVIIKSVRGAAHVSRAFSGRSRDTINTQSNGTDLARSGTPTRSRQITIMLMLDSFTIIISTLPFTLLGILKIDFGNYDNEHLAYSVAFYLMYVNRCANFFLYCLSGSRFRLALKTLCCKRSRIGRSTIYIVSGATNDTY